MSEQSKDTGNISISIGNFTTGTGNFVVAAHDATVNSSSSNQKSQIIIGGVPTTEEKAKELNKKFSFLKQTVKKTQLEPDKKAQAITYLEYLYKWLKNVKSIDKQQLARVCKFLASLSPAVGTALASLLMDSLFEEILGKIGVKTASVINMIFKHANR